MTGPDWINFPSLAALRAFEAVARLGGFSAAARSLNVTHAAVAQQVRALERELGHPLVFRDGRSLNLTEKGRALASELTNNFVAIQSAANAVRADVSRPVSVTLSPSFAVNWLMPRLGKFWRDQPDIQVSLQPDHRVVDLAREGFDLGIRFGLGRWPGVDAQLLTSAHYVIVASPEFLEGRPPLTRSALAALPWALEPDWPEHREWLASQTGVDPSALQITEFATDELALQAARQGFGLHVSSYALVEQDVRQGRLRIAFEAKEDALAYFIVTPLGPKRESTRTFIRWLKANV